jgi:hypothetical protein
MMTFLKAMKLNKTYCQVESAEIYCIKNSPSCILKTLFCVEKHELFTKSLNK